MLEELRKKASDLAGRPVEVEKVKSGKLVVMWMRFGTSPPEPADTEEEALERFILKMEGLKKEDQLLPQADISEDEKLKES